MVAPNESERLSPMKRARVSLLKALLPLLRGQL
jgi:hypothetical protein